MTRVFLTGMSGTGTSTVTLRLAELGYRAVDLDEPHWSEHDGDGDWIWREERVRRLLDEDQSELLFVSGCPTNQVKFYDRFDYIVLLSAPREVIVERVRSRTNNDYGKRPGELEQILANLDTVEPRLRRVASFEIDTRAPIDEVVDTLLERVGAVRWGA
jgi:dephospho-CoA kinase